MYKVYVFLKPSNKTWLAIAISIVVVVIAVVIAAVIPSSIEDTIGIRILIVTRPSSQRRWLRHHIDMPAKFVPCEYWFKLGYD